MHALSLIATCPICSFILYLTNWIHVTTIAIGDSHLLFGPLPALFFFVCLKHNLILFLPHTDMITMTIIVSSQ